MASLLGANSSPILPRAMPLQRLPARHGRSRPSWRMYAHSIRPHLALTTLISPPITREDSLRAAK